MREKIQHALAQLENEKNIKILLACETGSRAWGFPSPDSDYDVRILYVHNTDWYLSINNSRDTLELMLENRELDLSGWELRKSLQLLRKSNPPLLERIQSPIIYAADEEFIGDMRALAQQCYSPIASIHHYLSMAQKIREELSMTQQHKLKKLFYALRAATLCKWILYKTALPPIEFPKAYRGLGLDQRLVQRIDELIELKAHQAEAYLHTQEPLVIEFIDHCIEEAETRKASLAPSNFTLESLNQVLRKYIYKHDPR